MITLRNHLTGEQEVDRLHHTARVNQKRNCLDSTCLGSTYGNGGKRNEVGINSRPVAEVESQAEEFLIEYYDSIGKANSAEYRERLLNVKREITETNGTYELTEDELNYGVKLAWRNAPRCIGRIQWRNIKVFDARKISTAKEMFDAICRHIIYTTNNGNIRSTITVFPMRQPGKPDFRIWNHFIIGYAGYQDQSGSILGHSLNTELTEICLKLGWKCPDPKTKQDILPLVLSANGGDPELFVIPPEIVLEVNLEHPEFAWFKELNIRWFTLPLLSAMLFDCGGLQFPAAPFNGWFTSPEIASRDLGDVNRYNYLQEVASKMGLKTQHSTNLWKDKAMVELNIAVLHSFQNAGVTIIDHHTAAEQFISHLKTEQRERGGCPADWAWIVPPISGSTVPVFHQEMALYFMKPSYEYQLAAWKVHVWNGENPLANKGSNSKRLTLRQVSFVVIFSSTLFFRRLKRRHTAIILYATETGKSEVFAKRLEKVFSISFNPQICRMDKYDLSNLHQKSLLIMITSTFGNGDPPVNGESFYKYLSKMKLQAREETGDNHRPLQHLRFAVFALGSSAYPNVCAFGRNLDYTLDLLGGQRLISIPCGDELRGQGATFREWSRHVYQAACEAYSIRAAVLEPEEAAVSTASSGSFRFRSAATTHGGFNLQNYEKLLGRKLAFYNLVQREHLHKPLNDAQTVRIVLEAPTGDINLEYRVGDHIGIFPQNQKHLVTLLLAKLKNKPETKDIPVELQFQSLNSHEWKIYQNLPTCSINHLLENILDITTPASQEILSYLESIATDKTEKDVLHKLSRDINEYESWKEFYRPHLVRVLEMYPSCTPDAATICSLLPIMQPRYYSVSSSSKVHKNQLHLTVGVVQYTTEHGVGQANFGVCSNYLNELKLGASVVCFVRNTSSETFRLPKSHTQPVILIGPGTGIAPFRGFWEERQLLQEQGHSLGKLTLFFGCRSKEMVLYGQEVEEKLKGGVVTNYFIAFSREKNVKKTYVQDLILQHRDEVLKQILEEMAVTYICGDAAMAEDVFMTLQKLVQDTKKLSHRDAVRFMRSLKESDRCHMDIFGQTHKGRKDELIL